jgi:two-component system response regulator DesR
VGVGFRLLLGRQPWVKRCLHATTATEAFEHARRYQPHVALIAYEIAEASKGALFAEIARVSPGTRTIVTLNTPSVSAQALKTMGACGFISKLWPVEDAVAVIRAAGLGLEFAATQRTDEGVKLSTREYDVLSRIAMGETNREIAAALYLSPHTVKQHASAAFRKVEARNRTEAVEHARRLGLIA